jgi:hypothetical protein
MFDDDIFLENMIMMENSHKCNLIIFNKKDPLLLDDSHKI